MTVWKLLAAAALVLPPVAYVAGSLSSVPAEPAPREVVVLGADDTEVEPEVVIDRSPSAPPSPTSHGREDRDCDDDEDEDEDDVDVIRPCPEDLDDDDGDDDRHHGGDDDGDDDDHEDDD